MRAGQKKESNMKIGITNGLGFKHGDWMFNLIPFISYFKPYRSAVGEIEIGWLFWSVYVMW